MLKIAFVGFGSIARRHILNLHTLLGRRGAAHEIDVYRRGKRPIDDPAAAKAVSHIYDASEVGKQEYDILFITNPTSTHYETLRQWAPYARNVFIENRCSMTRIRTCPHCPCVRTAFTMWPALCAITPYCNTPNAHRHDECLFRPGICSSYLPDWRPGTDYRACYSAHKDMGGGVAIDLVHEWDYLTWLMGFPQEVRYFGGTYSPLEIDSDDLAVYMGRYSNRIVELHLDYFGRRSQRTLELFTAGEVITLDLLAGTVSSASGGNCRTTHLDAARDNYQTAELAHFLDIIEGRVPNDNTIENATRVLRLAQKERFDMAILFTVCGRAGSKGFQSKNLKDFLSVPLVYYTLAAIRLWQQRAGEEIDVVLNTDSEALCDIVTAQKSLPMQLIHRRAELGGDTVPKVSVIRDCLDQMEARTGKTYEMVVDLDITSPLRTVGDVAAAIEKSGHGRIPMLSIPSPVPAATPISTWSASGTAFSPRRSPAITPPASRRRYSMI